MEVGSTKIPSERFVLIQSNVSYGPIAIGSFIYHVCTKRGRSRAYSMRTRGDGGLTHVDTYTKMPLFIYCNFVVFSYARYFFILRCLWRRLLLLFYETFAMIIFLSVICFTVFFSVELLPGYLKTLLLEMEGGSDGQEYVHNGGVLAIVLVCTMGKGGVKFFHFGVYILI